MSDDVLAAMGIAGFGKTVQKKALDPTRFDKNKRSEVCHFVSRGLALRRCHLLFTKVSTEKRVAVGPAPGPSSGREPSMEQDSDDDEGPAPPPKATTDEAAKGQEEPEWEPEEDEDDTPEFPITHEINLKDHTKVVSALALDPSGARVVSGSHDYDCKLWDFGGMDMRCKPFKSWEPAGTYYVRTPRFTFNDELSFVFHSKR